MAVYESLKLFDLAKAPLMLRDAPELEPLKPAGPNLEAGVVPLHVRRVGLFAETESLAEPGVSLTEHLLYRWLIENGCFEGEKVLLSWVGADSSLGQTEAMISALHGPSTLN